MPKLPILSGHEIVRILESKGFQQSRQRGSHVTLRCGDRVCVVPLHREVAIGTLAGVLRQAGLSGDEFVQALMQ